MMGPGAMVGQSAQQFQQQMMQMAIPYGPMPDMLNFPLNQQQMMQNL